MKIPSVVAIGLSLAAFGGVQAQTSSPSFSDLDANGDGKISAAEARKSQALAKQFNDLDADGDGNLSRMEFAKFEQSHQ